MLSTGWGTPTCMFGSECSFELHELPVDLKKTSLPREILRETAA